MKKNISLFSEIIILSFLSYFFLILIYPDRYLDAVIRFDSGHDITVPFQAAFAHSGYFFRKSFDFWSIYDQTNHAFFQISYGFHTFAAFAEAIVFNLLSIFFNNKSLIIHLVHSFLFQFICIFFVTTGSLLILKFYEIKNYLRIILIVSFNTLLSVQIISGLLTSVIYSLIPLLIYLLIELFYKKNFIYLIYFFGLFSFCFAQTPLFTLGYFFLPFHFILVLFFLLCLKLFFFNKKKFKLLFKKFFVFKLNKFEYFLIISCVVIFFFNISYFFLLNDTVSLNHEGINSTNRFERFLNPIAYFKAYTPTYLNENMFTSYINYKKNSWGYAPTFLGLTIIFLTLAGIIYNSKKEIYIFFLTVVYIILLQGPRDILIFYPSTYAHLFNSFLNPFAFLIQHTHMTLLTLPFFLIPLIANGIKNITNQKKFKFNLKKNYIFILVIFLGIYFINQLFNFEKEILIYTCVISLLFIFIILFQSLHKRFIRQKNYIIIFVICLCFLIDIFCLKVFLVKIPFSGEKLFARQFDDVNSRKGHYYLSYQNPISQPFPEFFRTSRPEIKYYKDNKKEWGDDESFARAGYMGMFYKTILFYRQLEKPTIYENRHKIFADADKYENFKNLNDNLSFVSLFSDKNFNAQIRAVDREEINLNIKDVQLYKNNNNLNIYKIKFIKNDNRGTNIFLIKDQISLFVNKKKLTSIQNIISANYEFDINNFESNYIYFSLPEKESIRDINLILNNNKYIYNFSIEKNIYSFTVKKNPVTKYCLVRIPYDKNWIIKNNGLKIQYEKSDKYWISFTLNELEENNIKITYDVNRYFLNTFTLLLYFVAQIYIIFFLIIRFRKL